MDLIKKIGEQRLLVLSEIIAKWILPFMKQIDEDTVNDREIDAELIRDIVMSHEMTPQTTIQIMECLKVMKINVIEGVRDIRTGLPITIIRKGSNSFMTGFEFM